MGSPDNERRVWIATAALAAAGVVLGAVWLWWDREPPQMGSSDEVFAAVDGLFTAVNARSETLLEQSDARLQKLAASGQLSADAASFLTELISECRAGGWAGSAQKLYGFMEVQRRER